VPALLRPARALALLLPALAALAGACGRAEAHEEAAAITGGDPERGRAAIRAYGCGNCHTVPGVPGADALVGPSLAGMPHRAYVAGVLTNGPDNLVRWIRDPQGVDSLTAMPNLGVTERDARDMAAYLYTLR
jgi:cytochrome c1